MKHRKSLTKINLTNKLPFSSMFLKVRLLFGKKKQEKIYEAFQNSSLKRQRVKVGTDETVCSHRIQLLIL